jgi:hypothetical protein
MNWHGASRVGIVLALLLGLLLHASAFAVLGRITWSWWLVIALAAAVLAKASLVWWWMRRRKGRDVH